MAQLVNASGEKIYTTSNLPSPTSALTVCGWAKFNAVGTSFRSLWSLETDIASSPEFVNIGVMPSGVMNLTVADDGFSSDFASGPAAGDWFFWYVKVDTTTSPDTWYGGFRTLTGSWVTTNGQCDANWVPQLMALGSNSYDEFGDTVIGTFKSWTATLTAEQLDNEMWLILPTVLTSLNRFSPFDASDFGDYSGNGYGWSTTGTVTAADAPPVTWGTPPAWMIPIVAAGGTEYDSSPSGGITPTGAVSKGTAKTWAGTLTPAGALAKLAAKAFEGALGLAGTLVTALTYAATLAGSLTPSGAVTKLTGKGLAGALGLAGAILRDVGKQAAGSLTPSGALDMLRTFFAALSGALTPVGTLTKDIGKTLAGALTPAGTLAKSAAVALAGAITPTGSITRLTAKLLSGALGIAGDLAADLEGALTQSAGGVLGLAGTLTKATSKGLAGALVPVGSLAKSVAVTLAGALTPAGALSTAKAMLATLAGSMTPTGSITRTIGKSVAGTLTAAGGLGKAIAKALAGALGLAGTLIGSLLGDEGDKADVTLTDAAVTVLTLTDAAVTTLTLADSARTVLSLEDSTI